MRETELQNQRQMADNSHQLSTQVARNHAQLIGSAQKAQLAMAGGFTSAMQQQQQLAEQARSQAVRDQQLTNLEIIK